MSDDVVLRIDSDVLARLARRADRAARRASHRKVFERPVKGARAARGVRRLMRMLARDEAHATRVLERRLVARFDEFGARAGRAYGEAKAPDIVTVTAVAAVLRPSEWRDTILRGELVRHYARVLLLTGETLNAALGLGVMLPDPVQRVVIEAGGRRAGLIDVDGQTREALFRAIADGRAAGEGPAALAKRIEGYVAAGRFKETRTRARLIARTETKYAQNASTIAVYRDAPAITGCIAYDNRGSGGGDQECIARDGEFFTFDEASVEADSEHPNGTLSFGPATGGP